MIQLNLSKCTNLLCALIISAISLSSSAVNAQISFDINGDMENWTMGTVVGQTYDSLICWDTPQRLGAALGVADTVTFMDSTNVFSGNLAARLVTRDVIIAGVVPATVPGAISTGTFFVDLFGPSFGVTGGKDINCSPISLSGVAEYLPAGVDTAAVNVLLLLGSDTIGGGTMDIMGGGPAGYQPFTVPIVNFAPVPPTSIQITITSSKGAGQDGSTLYVDALELLCPSCDPPTGLNASVGSTSATLSWSPAPGASAYRVVGHEVGNPILGRRVVAGTSKTINILDPGVMYEWTVQSLCGTTDKSPYAPIQTFTTIGEARLAGTFGIYPNPAADQFSFQLNVSEETQVALYNISGVQVRVIKAVPGQTSYSLDVSSLAEGLYILQMGQGESVEAEIIKIVR